MDALRQYIEKRQSELGISQNQVAVRAGKSAAWLHKFMTGERKELKIDSLIALAKALQVSEIKLIAAYKGQNPEAVQDEQKYKAPLMDLLAHLPDEIILEALKARPPHEVLKGLIESKGMEKIQECLAEAKRRQQAGERD